MVDVEIEREPIAVVWYLKSFISILPSACSQRQPEGGVCRLTPTVC